MFKNRYFKPRSEEETNRLNEQGLVIENALNYPIHPSISTTLASSPSIADIGTGTGDYLLRLSQNLPSTAQLHGFDISPSQFISQSNLPSNIKLSEHNAKTPFPAEYHGAFDFVHVRLLAAGLCEQDWKRVTENLLSLLKPGGAIQWVEVDVLGGRRLRGNDPNTTAKNLDILFRPFVELGESQFRFGFSTLPGVFRDAGLERVEQDVVASDRVVGDRERVSRNGVDGVVLWAKKVMEGDGSVDLWPGRSLEEVERRALDDVANGAYVRYDIFATVGFVAG